MSAKVFISCGQRPEERDVGEKVEYLLKDLGFFPYLAFRINSLDDIMKITDELNSSDYYLFIDFLRKNGSEKTKTPFHLPISLFTHQELALARHLGFTDSIILQENGAPLEGFLKYIQSNPFEFSDRGKLPEIIKEFIKEKKWDRNFSRNLVVHELGFKNVGPLPYYDHTGLSVDIIWQVRIQNLRNDKAAVGTVCILDYISDQFGKKTELNDRSYLKWAGQSGYERTILPEDYGDVDLVAFRIDQPGVFLHSLADLNPRKPIIEEDGEYRLRFKMFSSDFPLVSFSIKIALHRGENPVLLKSQPTITLEENIIPKSSEITSHVTRTSLLSSETINAPHQETTISGEVYLSQKYGTESNYPSK